MKSLRVGPILGTAGGFLLIFLRATQQHEGMRSCGELRCNKKLRAQTGPKMSEDVRSVLRIGQRIAGTLFLHGKQLPGAKASRTL